MSGASVRDLQFLEARAALFREPIRERQRITVVMALRNLVTATERLADAFESAPDDDAAFDLANLDFAREIGTADVLLTTYRHTRDCQGES